MQVNTAFPDLAQNYHGPNVIQAIRAGQPLCFLNLTDNPEYNQVYSGYNHNFYGFLEDGRRVHVLVYGATLYFDILVGDMEEYDGPMRSTNRAINPGTETSIAPDIHNPGCVIDDTIPAGQTHSPYPEYGHVSCEDRIADPAIYNILYEQHATTVRAIEYTLKAMMPSVASYERILRFPADKFQQFPSLFIRVHFVNNQDRQKIIANTRALQYQTYMDDTPVGNIPFALCRTYGITLAGWNVMEKYDIMYNDETDRDWNAPGAIIRLTCDIHNMKKAPESAFLDIESSRRSNISVHSFDLETMTMRRDASGQRAVPLPHEQKDFIATIGGTFSWSGESRPWYSFCISLIDYPRDSPAFDDKDGRGPISIFVCKTEKALLKKYIEILAMVRPGIISGFNSANYDLPFIVEKCRKHKLLSEYYSAISCVNRRMQTWDVSEGTILTRRYSQQTYKIKADDIISGWNLEAPGMLFVDTMIVMRKLYPNEEKWSLSHFLKLLNLESKDEMPYARMFKIIENGLGLNSSGTVDLSPVEGQDAAHVLLYCTRDANACDDIWLTKNILMVIRANAETAHVTMANSFFRANGIKCRMFMMAHAVATHSFCWSLIPETITGKYPGAYVSDPTVQGIEFDLTEEELDVQSLYPSIIRAYNIGSDKLISSLKDIARYIRRGIVFNYQCVEMASGEKFDAWFAWHEEHNNLMGIMPAILKDLFWSRRKLKAELEKYEEKMELILQVKGRPSGTPNTPNDEEILASEPEVSYYISSMDATQLALKVYMNTFYGESGSKQSPFFNVRIAGSVTAWGVKLIKAARAMAEEKGYWYFYGDTDSLYVGTPVRLLAGAIDEYSRGAITLDDYWYRLITISQVAADNLKVELDDLFFKMSGTRTIRFSHDTTGFPAMIACKKKYSYLLQAREATLDDGSITRPNLYYSKFMKKIVKIKGMEIVKRGRTPILQEIGQSVLFRIFHPNSLIEMLNRGCHYDNTTGVLHTLEPDTSEGAVLGALRPISRDAPEIPVGATVLLNKFADESIRALATLTPIARLDDGRTLGVNEKLEIPSDRAIRRPPSSRDAYDLIFNIIQDEVIKLLSTQWSPQQFVKTAVYRLNDAGEARKNPSVIRFVNRMRVTGGKVPEVGVRFSYVVVMRPNQIDAYGRLIKYMVGDLWEYPETVEHDRLPINIPYYIKGEFTGMLARFLTYRFQGIDDDTAFKHAKKLIIDITTKSSPFYAERERLRAQARQRYLIGRRLITAVFREKYGKNNICSAMDIESLKNLIAKSKIMSTAEISIESLAAENMGAANNSKGNDDTAEDSSYAVEDDTGGSGHAPRGIISAGFGVMKGEVGKEISPEDDNDAMMNIGISDEPDVTDELDQDCMLNEFIDATTGLDIKQIREKRPSLHMQQLIAEFESKPLDERIAIRSSIIAGRKTHSAVSELRKLTEKYKQTIHKLCGLLENVPMPVEVAESIVQLDSEEPALSDEIRAAVLGRYPTIINISESIKEYKEIVQAVNDKRKYLAVITSN